MSALEIWEPALLGMSSLLPKAWVLAQVLDLYLLAYWFTSPATRQLRYIDRRSAGADAAQMRDGLFDFITVPRFRSAYSLPQDVSTTSSDHEEPVCFFVLEEQHYFTVILDPQRDVVHVLGRSRETCQSHDEWTQWEGPSYFRRISKLLGWRRRNDTLATIEAEITVYNVGWLQNGYDCGPLAASAAIYYMTHGLIYCDRSNTLARPPHLCGHQVRLSMYVTLQQVIIRCSEDYNALHMDPPDEWYTWDAGLPAQRPPHAPLRAAITQKIIRMRVGTDDEVLTALFKATRTCSQCTNFTENRPIPNPAAGCLKNIDRTTTRDREAIDFVETEGDCYEQQHQEAAMDRADDLSGPLPPGLENRRRLLGKEQRPIFHGNSAGRLRTRHAPNVQLQARQGPLWRPFDALFDDYFGDPTRDDYNSTLHQQMLSELHPYFLFEPNQPQGQVHWENSIWMQYQDHGYRILPRFNESFYRGFPQQTLEHVMQVPIALAHSHDEPSSRSEPSTRRNRRGEIIDLPTDRKDVGLAEMLRMAQGDLTTTNIDVMVRGRDADGHYLRVDLEKDERALPPEQINVSLDIDSMIFVTRKCKVKSAVNVITGPTSGRTPPIAKNNHVYAEILRPPVDNEPRGMDRAWLESKTPLSAIPHVHFARLREGEGAINIYLFLPRMIHRNELTGRREALVPFEIQEQLWSMVILPAMKASSPETALPYVDVSVPERMRRAAGPGKMLGNSFKPKGIAMQPGQFHELQDRMDAALRTSQEPTLSRFKSHFFVLETKGVKLSSMTPISKAAELWPKLRTEFAQLDIDYMLDRNNGEFIIDLGFVFQPRQDARLVGLWRLNALEQSAAAGGYKVGTSHTADTFSAYGGLQAEMTVERSLSTHILFQSAYNLYYEAFRRSNNKPTFAEDCDAFAMNDKYRNECRKLTSTCHAARNRSYGVRMELRVGALAAMEILKDPTLLVSLSYCDSTITNSSTSHAGGPIPTGPETYSLDPFNVVVRLHGLSSRRLEEHPDEAIPGASAELWNHYRNHQLPFALCHFYPNHSCTSRQAILA